MHRIVIRLLFAALLGGSIAGLRAAAEPPALPTLPTLPTFAEKEKDKNGNGGVKFEPLPPFVESGPEMSLGDCIAVALERQPSLKAVKASMAATQLGYNSLMNFKKPSTFISPDLDIRKQQAERGLTAAAAEYQKAHNEVVQDVTRLYYSAVYAKQVEPITLQLGGQLKTLIDIAWELIKNEPDPTKLGGLTTGKIHTMEIGLLEIRLKQSEARTGRQQAMAALRQVMGVEETFAFRVKDAELPLMAQKVPFTKELAIEQALCRRPELTLAAAGVDAFRLEVYAQGKIAFKRKVLTFASGADLHSKEIPVAIRTTKEYRPGGVGPELPPQLVGSKFDRVTRAMAFSQRADAVYESARSLVSLEAENGYLELEYATQKLKSKKEELDIALKIEKYALENSPNTKDKSVVVQALVLAAKARADYLEAAFQHLMTLSAMERITGGGIQPAFPDR